MNSSDRLVGSTGRRESVARTRCRCGFGETWQLADLQSSSVLSYSVVVAFKWRGLAPRQHRLLRIVVRGSLAVVHGKLRRRTIARRRGSPALR